MSGRAHPPPKDLSGVRFSALSVEDAKLVIWFDLVLGGDAVGIVIGDDLTHGDTKGSSDEGDIDVDSFDSLSWELFFVGEDCRINMIQNVNV